MISKKNSPREYFFSKGKSDVYDYSSDDDDFNSDTIFNQQSIDQSYTSSEKSHNKIDFLKSDDDDFNSDGLFTQKTKDQTFLSSEEHTHTLDPLCSDDDDFNSDEVLSINSNSTSTMSTKQENTNSHELCIKISKDEKQERYPKSISDNDLAELLVKENHLIILDNVLHYWSKSKNHYIPLLGDNADKFIRLRTPAPYKRKINQRSINEIIQWLKINENLKIDSDSFNNMQQYVAFQNGIYDLKSNQLLKHSPNYYLVNIIQANYPDEPLYLNYGEQFEQFLSDITEDDPDLYNRLQELFGYVLSNIRNVKCIPFLVGVKDTGKSIVLKLLETLIGEASFTNLSFEQLNTPVFLAELIGKKLNTCGELGEFKLNRLDVFKKLSGGDNLLAKPLYEKPIKFKNSAALIFAGNHLPIIKGLDKANAFSNRLAIFPFMNPISKEKQDIYLFEKLLEESGYIVHWAMEGLKRWQLNNYEFTTCELIEELSQKYAQQNNSIENFIKDWCYYDPSSKTYRSELESSYYEYCDEKGLTPVPIKELHNQIKLDIRLGHKRFRKNGENKFGYIGIGVKEVGGYNNEFTF